MSNFSLLSTTFLKEQAVYNLLACNQVTLKYGLTLSEKDVICLIETRENALKETKRLEMGEGVIGKLIETFKDSPYIWQSNYVEIISGLIELFYYYKNETLDKISDDELIEVMRELFDYKCHGCIELLQGRELERIAHNIKYGVWDLGIDKAEGEGEEDE